MPESAPFPAGTDAIVAAIDRLTAAVSSRATETDTYVTDVDLTDAGHLLVTYSDGTHAHVALSPKSRPRAKAGRPRDGQVRKIVTSLLTAGGSFTSAEVVAAAVREGMCAQSAYSAIHDLRVSGELQRKSRGAYMAADPSHPDGR